MNAFLFDNVYYQTEEEVWVAEMLTHAGIPFYHHVVFPFQDTTGKNWNIDFAFGLAYRWTHPTFYNGSVLAGIEVKRKIDGTGDTPVCRSRRLISERGIPILVLPRLHIEPLYRTKGRLPLKPVKSLRLPNA